MIKKQLEADIKAKLLGELKIRFTENMHRHPDLCWSEIESRIVARPTKLWSLQEMERTGGQPDVAGVDEKTGEFIFCDFAAESPKGRRSLCYDLEALESRKEHKPKHNAVDLASEMGIEILNEAQYRDLQKLENFDSKTSSWLKTPSEIRQQGGAIFGDFRYTRVFIYHNGAQSYYAARGFRGRLLV